MACTYYSYSVFEQFTDEKILEKALYRLSQRRNEYRVNGLTVEANTTEALGLLKQIYQTEAAKAALKKKGFLVTETKTTKGIKLTVRGA
jgi:hypothetical protein